MTWEPTVVEDRHEVTQGESIGYIIGLDLGKSMDFTALTVDELIQCDRLHWRRTAFEPIASVIRRRPVKRHQIVNLRRYPLGTSYPEIYSSVQGVLHQLPARKLKPELVVDATGVGRPVVDGMRALGMRPIGVTITGGQVSNMVSSNDFTVPKALLASVLDICLSEERLEITNQASASEPMRAELQGFHAKVGRNGNTTLEAHRVGVHDDLILSMAMAVWRGENLPQPARWLSPTERIRMGAGIGR